MSETTTTRQDDYEAELLAAEAIGDVIEHWGFRRVLGRVWTILFIAGEPLPAATIGERREDEEWGENETEEAHGGEKGDKKSARRPAGVRQRKGERSR